MTREEKIRNTGQPDLPPAPETLCKLYDVLSAPRRWHTIFLLASTTEQSLSVRAVATQITAVQEDVPPSHATGDIYNNRYASLCQNHLPVMAEVGIIKYDSDRKRLTTGPQFPLALLLARLTYVSYDTMQSTAPTVEQ